MAGTKPCLGRVCQEHGQGYEGLRFGHVEHVHFVYETSQEVEHTDGVDCIEGLLFHSELDMIDVDSDLGGLE